MTLVKVNNGFSKSIDGMMKDLFNELPSAVSKTFREDVLYFPPVNIINKDAAYSIELAAPGFEKADFNVKLDNNILTISTEKKGLQGFGYDPIFIPEGSLKTFAEMDLAEKNYFSHRKKAVLKLVDFLNNI